MARLAALPLSAKRGLPLTTSCSTRRWSVGAPPISPARKWAALTTVRARRGFRFADQALVLFAGDALEIVAILEEHAERVVDRLRIESHAVERDETVGPIDRLGDAGKLEELALAQPLHEGHYLARQRRGSFGCLAVEDLELARGVRVVHPVIETAALHRIVDLARAVGSDDHDRWLVGLERAELGDRDLPVGQHFEEVRLEWLVGAVELIDQQDG